MLKELEERFERKKVKYEQVFRNEGWYIYKCTDIYGKPYYEVFSRKIADDAEFVDGKWVKNGNTKVRYPSDECFGNWAWCCNSYDRAMRYVNGKLPITKLFTEGVSYKLMQRLLKI